MASIRDYTGPIFLCTSCGQPCYEGTEEPELGLLLQHFHEQWDGVHCEMFPLASGKIEIKWDEDSLADVKASYPDTYPH